MNIIDDSKLVLRCREVHDIAVAASNILYARMEAVGRENFVYTFKSRHKAAGAILSKVRRKQEEQLRTGTGGNSYHYTPDSVTDTWGCRYVTLYQSQIPTTVRALLSDFDAYNSTNERKIELVEFVIYTNRPTEDPLSITKSTLEVLKTCQISSGPKPEVKLPENRKSAYSSVHLIFAMPVAVDFPGTSRVEEVAKFEVQVRDIFEEGWGEIQHNLIYSEKDKVGQASTETHAFDPLWQPHLNALKTFVDGCSQHASIIKSSYDFILHRSMPTLDTESATPQITDRDAIIKALNKPENKEAVGSVALAYDILIDAQNAQVREEAQSQYIAAAEQFKKAMGLLGDRSSSPIKARHNIPAEYFLKTELANCNAFSRVPDRQREAMDLYEQLIAAYPEDPTVHLRLGNVISNLEGDTRAGVERAISLLERAISLIRSDPLTGKSHWINISSRVHLGFLHWRLSKLLAGAQECGPLVLAELEKAIQATLQGFDFWKKLPGPYTDRDEYRLQAHKALSNLLYYSAKFVLIKKDHKSINAAAIKSYISQLDEINVPNYREFFKTRDNVMHALIAVGDLEQAQSLARENLIDLRKRAEARSGRSLVATEVDQFLENDEKTNYQAAVATLAEIVNK